MKRTFYTNLIKLSLSTSLILGGAYPIASYASKPNLPTKPVKDQRLVQIVEILLKHALTYDIDKRSVDSKVLQKDSITLKGFDGIEVKIQAAVEENKPIELNFVGFPYKSTNTDKKVLAHQLDAAERHSLVYLNDMLADISKIYQPGAILTIFTDGMVFCDIEGFSDQIVENYEQQLKHISQDLKHIRIVTLSDLLPGKTPAEMRSTIETYEPSEKAFQEKILNDNHLKDEIELLAKRMVLEMDHSAGRAYLAQHPPGDIAKKLTHRGMQYSAFLGAHRPKGSIRLSVHYQADVSTKMGIKLAENSYVTAWHGVLIQNSDGSKQIAHLEDVDPKNYIKTSYTLNGLSLSYLTWRRR